MVTAIALCPQELEPADLDRAQTEPCEQLRIAKSRTPTRRERSQDSSSRVLLCCRRGSAASIALQARCRAPDVVNQMRDRGLVLRFPRHEADVGAHTVEQAGARPYK
jgi:hypothetical protein